MADKLLKYDVAMKSTKTVWQMETPICYTGDENTVTFDFNIIDLEEADLVGVIPNVYLYMRDGSFFQNGPADGVEITGTTVNYTMKGNEGKHSGIAKAQLVLVWDDEVNPPEKLTSQMYAFEVVSGLENKVAVEVMIQDWTTLTREARTFIDTSADEVDALKGELQTAITAANTSLGEFDVALQNGIVATNIAAELQNLEETYAPDLFTVKKQLEQTSAQVDLLNRGLGETFATLTDLQTAYPIGDTKDHIVGADGHRYYWDDTVWADGGAYQAVELLDNVVTPQTTTFMVLKKNLINPAEFADGYYVNQITGALAAFEGLFVSGLINVVGLQTYYYQNTMNGASDFRRAWYDENKVYISGATGSFSVLTAPANARYLRFSTKTDYINATHQLALGDSASTIEEYGYNIQDTYISSNFVVDVNDIVINLPATIPAIVGQQIDIYLANITNANLTNYDVDIVCATGKQMDDGFHVAIWTAGTYPITINVYKDGKLKASASSNIVVKPTSVGNGITKKVLYIGDSTIAQNTLTQGLIDKFNTDVMDLTLIGTKGIAPNKYEATSGWTLGNFRLSGSAFYNGTDFDFGYYLSQNDLAVPDYVMIQLGINDVFSMIDDTNLETTLGFVLNHYNHVINNIKAYNANIKVGICLTIPPNANQDAFGNAYNCGQTRWRYLINNKTLVKRLMSAFEGRESENIYLIPNNAFINTATNITDAVHPSSAGYGQLSNLHYAWLKSFEG